LVQSSRSRGDRRRLAEEGEVEEGQLTQSSSGPADPEFVKAARSSWARLIRKVYEVDPLTCPHCGSEMRFVALIEEVSVIERILAHLGVWDPQPPLRAPPADDDWPESGQIPLTYGPFPDIA